MRMDSTVERVIKRKKGNAPKIGQTIQQQQHHHQNNSLHDEKKRWIENMRLFNHNKILSACETEIVLNGYIVTQ